MTERSDLTDVSGEELANTLARVTAVLAGSILFKVGFAINNFLTSLGSVPRLLTLFATYLVGFGLITAAVVDLDWGKWGPRLANVVTGVITFDVVVGYLTRTSPFFGTDAMLFARYSVHLLLEGTNPYARSMAPAFTRYPISEQHVTYRTSAEVVTSLSYPALSFLAYVPQTLLGIPNLNLTTVVVFLVVVLFLVRESPGWLALAPFVVMFLDPSLLAFSFGGVFDILWVLPTLVAMRYWHRGRLRHAAFAVGTAYAVKQVAWVTGPFFAIWLYESSDGLDEFVRKVKRTTGYGLAAFLLPNLPFIVWSPEAWARGVLTPVAGGAALVQQGAGLTAVSVAGVYTLPKTAFTITMAAVLIGLLTGYALFFDRAKWLAWLAPALVLWFNHRSLQNYFVFFVPIAYYAAVLRFKERDLALELQPVDGSGDAWHPSSIGERRKRVTFAVLSVLLLASVAGSAVALHQDRTLDAEVTVTSMSDPENVHRTTQITLRVTNNEERPIQPVFNTVHGELQTHAYWNIVDGPRTLSPGETGVYEIRAPEAAFGVPPSTKFVIGVNDRGTQFERKTVGRTDEEPLRTLRNPDFAYWNYPYGETTKVPTGWRTVRSDHGSEVTTLANRNGSAFVGVSNLTRTKGPWGMRGLKQTVPLPATVHVEATPHTVLEHPRRLPPRFAGVQLGETNHRIWIGFADVDDRTVVHRKSGDLSYTLVYLPAEEGERTSATVNVTAIYEARGWRYPTPERLAVGGNEYDRRTLDLLGFAAVYPRGTATSASITFHEVSTTSRHNATAGPVGGTRSGQPDDG